MNILWVKTELLHPVDKGGKIRTYNMLKALKRDHHITYLTLDDESDRTARDQALEYCHKVVCIPHHPAEKFTAGFYSDLLVNLSSPLPYAIKKYESPLMRAEIEKLLATNKFDVLICDFLAPAVNVPNKLRCASVLFQHNVEAMIWKRHYEVQTNPLKKSYLKTQWRKMLRFENEACGRFDAVVAVSKEDRAQMKQEYLANAVFDVPTGVDTEFFRPSGKEPADPHNLVFTGSMDWLPNGDAIRFFTEQILPLIKQSVPDVTLTIVGRNPYPGLRELSKKDSSVILTGRVDDVRPYIERAAAYVVPLRIGGGTRLKIYEALAMEKPMVSTTIGAEGLPLKDGVELLIADTPEAFASAVVRLLQNTNEASQMARRAANRVRANFGWDGVSQRFAEICESAIDQHHNTRVTPMMQLSNEEAAI
jgi:polysaccharide biosynthesis protein PslH